MSRKSNGPSADDFNDRLAAQQAKEREAALEKREAEVVTKLVAFMRARANELVVRAEKADAIAVEQAEKYANFARRRAQQLGQDPPPAPSLTEIGCGVVQCPESFSLHGGASALRHMVESLQTGEWKK